jgi:hypothetical protein
VLEAREDMLGRMTEEVAASKGQKVELLKVIEELVQRLKGQEVGEREAKENGVIKA